MTKINSALQLLTVDDTANLDHKKELQNAAKLLNESRRPVNVQCKLDDLKLKLLESSNLESLIHQLWCNPEARTIFQQIETSSCLEDFLQMGRKGAGGPLKDFPPNINTNLYSEIIKFALERSKSTVLFLLNMLVDKNKPVNTNDVIHIAFLISYLAHSVNRENDALVKLKALLLDKEGTTNEGVDALKVLGVTESSRSLRYNKDFLSGIAPELVKLAARKYPHQSTIDNLGKILIIVQ